MLGNKHIIDAQRILKRLEGTPVKVEKEHGVTFWQVTYDNDTYNNLLTVLSEVANIPLKDNYYISPNGDPVITSTPYHRNKI